jgi:hypothetical protein
MTTATRLRFDKSTAGHFELNWLCLFLVFASIPIIEMLGLVSGQPSSVPVPSAISLGLLGIFLICSGMGRFAFDQSKFTKMLTLFWLAAANLAVLLVAFQRHQLAGFSRAFLESLVVAALLAWVLHRLIAASPRLGRMHVLAAGCLALIFGGATVHGMLYLTMLYLPEVYDPVVCHLAQMLGLGHVGVFTRLLTANRFSYQVLMAIYNFLNIGVAYAAASEFFYARDNRGAGLILRFLVVAAIGYPLYYLMPAIAPQPFFGPLFPDHLPVIPLAAAHAVPVPATAPTFDPRNTVPSLHATWGILAFLALRHSPVWHKLLGFMFVAVILVVTLGLGQHYAIDWLAAFPLVLLVRGLCALTLSPGAAPRRDAVLTGAWLIGLWALVIRAAPWTLHVPVLIWLLAVASTMLPFWLERRLAKAEDTAVNDRVPVAVSRQELRSRTA